MISALHRPVGTPQAVDERETLVREMARALHAAGAPAHRLEQTVDVLARRVSLEARVFSTPTAVYASFGPEQDARTVLIRVERSGLDLGRLAEVDALTQRILDGEIDIDAAVEQLQAAAEVTERWGPAWQVPAFGMSSAAAAVLLGGGLGEVVSAAFVGIVVGLGVLASQNEPRLGSLTDLTAGLLAALAAGAWGRGVFAVDTGVVTIASLIVLVPGLTLTTAVTELATRHLVSGTARLSGAGVTFASLGLGALAGAAMINMIPAIAPQMLPLPEYAFWLAWPVAVLAFTPLMQARKRDLPLIALSTGVAMLSLRVAAGALPPTLAAAASSLAVALVSNLLARVFDRPAAVPLVPALFLLVPGSTGFRSLVALMGSDLQSGLDHAIAALITAAALAAGVIVAQAVLPPRRAL